MFIIGGGSHERVIKDKLDKVSPLLYVYVVLAGASCTVLEPGSVGVAKGDP